MASRKPVSPAPAKVDRRAAASANGRPVVLHSMGCFLPVSENWIYPQVTALERYQADVLAKRRENVDQFPLAHQRLYIVPQRHSELAETVSIRLGLGRDRPSYCMGALNGCAPHILHSHFGHRAYRDLALARKLRAAHVVTFYGFDLSKLPRERPWPKRFAALFRRAALFMVEGPHMAESLAALGCPEEKIRIRRHGVDLQEIPFVPREPSSDGAVRVLVAARFTEKKGIPYALRAIAEVARRFPQVRLTLVGDAHPNNPAQQQLKTRILNMLEEPPLSGRSRWIGTVPLAEFRRIAAGHHLFVQASVHAADGDCEGGAPVSLTQLAATGMPIVATRHCDIPEVVLDGRTGFLAPERDAAALAACVTRLVSAPETWPRFGEAARRHVERRFELSKTIARLEEIYDEAIELHRGGRSRRGMLRA